MTRDLCALRPRAQPRVRSAGASGRRPWRWPVLAVCVVGACVGCGERGFRKWNLLKVREVVPPAEFVVRGVLTPDLGESRLFHMTGFEELPPDAPPLRRLFSGKITAEESERIVATLQCIFPRDSIPESLVRYSRKSIQNFSATGYRCRPPDADKWIYCSFVADLTMAPDQTAGVRFVKGYIGNLEPIQSHDDVYRVARRYMKPEFLRDQEDYTEWVGVTDKEEIKRLAKLIEPTADLADEDLRDIPRTFKLDNPTSHTYLRGGFVTIDDAGTLREMHGIGFRYLAYPYAPRE